MSRTAGRKPLTLVESAALFGRYRFIELELHRRVGVAAPECVDPILAVALSGAARAHGFRAALLEARLPVSVGLPDAAALTLPLGPGWLTLFDEVFVADQHLPALVGLVYPAMLDGYRAHLDRCTAAADPPLRRCLSRVVADLDQVREELSGLCEPPGDPTLLARAAALGPIFGPIGS
jgi:hypothetical protein